MDKADLKIRRGQRCRILESTKRVSGIFVSGSSPVELTEETVTLPEVVVETHRRFIPIEEISIRLELVRIDHGFQEIAISVERARLWRGER